MTIARAVYNVILGIVFGFIDSFLVHAALNDFIGQFNVGVVVSFGSVFWLVLGLIGVVQSVFYLDRIINGGRR